MKRQNKKKQLPKNSLRRRVGLAVIPQRANQYQPHLIRRYSLLAAVLLIVGVQVFYNIRQTGSVLGESANVSMEALVSQTNQARRQHDIAEISLNQKLNQAAYLKVTDMFVKQYWGHDAPDGTKPWKWFADAEYNYSEAGENLAKNFYTAEAVTTAWMNSTEHRDNILNPDYTDVGFAVASGTLQGKVTTIVVALYGRPASIGVASANIAVEGARSGSLNLITRLGIGLQSTTPAALGSILLLAVLMMIAFAAHLYRDYIPAAAPRPRHRHNHGLIKVGLLFMMILAMLVLYGGGQI